MQLKGLVKLITALFILGFLYQLYFTYAVRNVENALRAKAKTQVKATNPNATPDLVEARFNALRDSMQGKKLTNSFWPYSGYTFARAKNQTLNLGLDLQGGMSVTLDVSLDDLVRQLSNNPGSPELNNALAAASKAKGNSDRNFVTLFVEAFQQANPGTKLAYLFTKSSEPKITLQSTDQQVKDRLTEQADDAIASTYSILQKRIDKFGVSQPNVNLDKTRGVITVELAGVTDPAHVREVLQSTAKLQFFETYTNQEIFNDLVAANDALSLSLYGAAPVTDTAKKAVDSSTAGKGKDSAGKVGDLASLSNGGKATSSKDSAAQNALADEHKKPLFYKLQINQDLMSQAGPVVGYVAKADTAKLREYLTRDEVKAKLPADAKFLLGAELGDEKFNSNGFLPVYVMKAIPGSMGSKLEGEHVVRANAENDPATGRPEVTMQMDQSGAAIWEKMTRDATGKYVAVVLDDRVYSAPFNSQAISGGSTSISGGSIDIKVAQDLASILQIGKLPASAHIVQEQVVGPTLGQENIDAGFKSIAVAFIVIFLLMLVYYNTGGIVANIALVLNVFFTFGTLAVFGATLTMAGIAGLVLTIGMAVDTNVIVFERIKEELTAGKGYEQAVADGYKRSYAPVLDGHITQFLTAVILFIFGLGPVKGFATTQMIGLILSLYCGLLVSRLVTEMYMSRGRHFKYFTGLSKSIFRKAHFKFIELRKYTYVISGLVFALGIGSLFYGYDYGVEFAGGRSYDIRFAQKHTATEVREKLGKYFGGERPIVKTIGNNNTLNITTSYLIQDPSKGASDQVRSKLYTGLKAEGLIPADVTPDNFKAQYLGATGQERTVLPIISKDLKRGAIYATILSLLAIFFYILIRFRKWQYSLGTIIALLHDVSITLAVFSFLRGRVPFALEIDQHFIAAVLTVIGFSMNDTVIVFDRVREYFRKSPGERKEAVINRAINDTLSRTVMTSLTVFLTILILFIFGGEVIRGFAFAMLIGVITGTYSSIFVAAPILVDMDKGDSLKNEVDKEVRLEELKKLA